MRWPLPIKTHQQNIFFQPGRDELHCLSASQLLILEAFQEGYCAQEICDHLNNGSEDGTLQYVQDLEEHWKKTGLLSPDSPHVLDAPPYKANFSLGLSDIAVHADFPELHSRLYQLFIQQDLRSTPDHLIEVRKNHSSEMEVFVEKHSKHKCQNLDQVLIACLFEMGELATHEFPRLFVAHAAAVRNKDQVLLMPGQAGQGKSTLTAGLIKKGYQLINDDIVPVNFDGSLVAINSPLKIKSGSWPVLSNLYPELNRLEPVIRADGQIMKLVPQIKHSCNPGSTHMPTAIIIPEYLPNCEPQLTLLKDGEGLPSILLTAPYLPHRLSRGYLNAIADWQAKLPVWKVKYSHTDEAAQLLNNLPAQN